MSTVTALKGFLRATGHVFNDEANHFCVFIGGDKPAKHGVLPYPSSDWDEDFKWFARTVASWLETVEKGKARYLDIDDAKAHYLQIRYVDSIGREVRHATITGAQLAPLWDQKRFNQDGLAKIIKQSLEAPRVHLGYSTLDA
ncbi:MAG: hypothetical protein WBK55_00275 [Alphaproteobacteria bacterium]